MKAQRYLEVKNFAQFQHYKDRNPVWIKLYNSLLDDYEFLSLSDAARSQLILIWLLASRQDGRVPYDVKWISRALHLTGKLHVADMIAAGFLRVVDADSKPLAEAEQRASSVLAETEQDGTAPRALARGRGRGRERDREDTTATTACEREAVLACLPEAYHADLDEALRVSQRSRALLAELRSLAEGTITDGARFTWAEIGLGLHDLVANGKHERFNARQLRRYVEGARDTASPSRAGDNQKLSRAQRAYDNNLKALEGVA